MKTNITSFNWSALGSNILGIVALVLVVAFLTGRKVPIVVDDRSAFIALAVVGFVMCSVSMGKIANELSWTHPITIVGAVLGTLLILLVVAMLAGWRVPFVPDYRTAFMVLAVTGLVKWSLAWISRLFFNG